MNSPPDRDESIEVVLASDAELTGELPARVELYRRYWAVDSWHSEKSKMHWVETVTEIEQALATTHHKILRVVRDYPDHVEPMACPSCSGPLHISARSGLQQALSGSLPLCDNCAAVEADEVKSKVNEAAKEFDMVDRNVRKAFDQVICDDHRPEDCVGALTEPQIRLYLDMFGLYQKLRHEPDYGRESLGENPGLVLCGIYATGGSEGTYEQSGPDLYELARHLLLKPRGHLASTITLTRHGLINPSGYPYSCWDVADELDGWPILGLMNKRLRLLEEEA